MAATTTGSLDRYPLPRLLCFLHKKRFDGVLRLETRPEAREVQLQQGVPVSVSPDFHEKLIQLFVDRGRISRESLPELAEAMSLPYSDHEALLADRAGLSADEVRKGQRYALFQALVGLFGERDAAFSLTSGATHGDATGAVEPLYLVYQGLVSSYDTGRLLDELAPVAKQAIKARPGAEELLARCGAGEAESRVIQYLQRGYWLLEDLLAALPDQQLQVLRVTYLLVSAEAMDIAQADSVPRLRPKRPEAPAAADCAGNEPLAARWQLPRAAEAKLAETRQEDCVAKPAPAGSISAAPVTPPPALPAREAFAASQSSAPRVSGATPPPSVGSGVHAASKPSSPVTPTGEERVARARQTKSGLYARARLPPKVLRDAREAAAACRARNKDKPESLELLDELLRRLEEMEGKNPFELLGLGLDASALDVKKAYMVLVKKLHPDRLAALGLETMAEAADTLFKRLSEANQALSSEEQVVEARRIYKDAADGQDPEAAMRAIEAEVSFQKGEVFFRKGDLALAEEHFAKAVEGNAEEGEHLAMLAWTRYQRIARELRGQHRDAITKMMVQAVALSPRCARAHFFLGKLYQDDKRNDSALDSFRMAAKLKHGFIEAEREVRLIEMRQRSAKTTSNKSSIFDVFKRGKR
ncbi:MAG: DnaJ domain-containing protein [Polyangia bacterium]|jgi:curved DNA-binding protein CbpA|nr:DnaJ domain-containing protein [Polyangia bacterium]